VIARACVAIIEDPDENGWRLSELQDMYPRSGDGALEPPSSLAQLPSARWRAQLTDSTLQS
jgi:hypothetical protein